MGKLEGRVAIVTGGAQGIGKAIADKLAAEGASVVVADVNGAARPRRPRRTGGIGMHVDVSSEADVIGMVADTVAHYGRLDVLVNNAAIVPFVAWDDLDFAEWRRIMAVNLDGTFLAADHGHRADARGGLRAHRQHLPPTSSLAGTPNLAHYVASKGGILGFTRALAREIGKYGITVNAVAPGLTETEGTLASPHAEAFEFVQMLQCLPRRGVAADIAPVRGVPRLRGIRLGHRAAAGRRRGHAPQLMPAFPVARAGVILAVADVGRRSAFYRDLMGFALDALYDDPPYASLSVAGMRLSLAEQGHAAEDRPGVAMVAPADPSEAAAVLVWRWPIAWRSTASWRPAAPRCWRRPSRRPGAATGSSSGTPTATWWRSSNRHDAARAPAPRRGGARRRLRRRGGDAHAARPSLARRGAGRDGGQIRRQGPVDPLRPLRRWRGATGRRRRSSAATSTSASPTSRATASSCAGHGR